MELAAPLASALLVWTGVSKLRAPSTATVLGSGPRARLFLRGVGLVEILLAAFLVSRVAHPLPAIGTALLGCGFLGFLTYARIKAPTSSCGCTASASAPITWRAYARAGLVVGLGLLALGSTVPWWTVVVEDPVRSLLAVAVFALLLAWFSESLLLRRFRVRVLGHPLAGGLSSEIPPIEATLELLDRSLAWEQALPVVRSDLLEHWDADGWRFLRYAGESDGRPVDVLFALDVRATVQNAPSPAIRLSVVPAQDAHDARDVTDNRSRPAIDRAHHGRRQHSVQRGDR